MSTPKSGTINPQVIMDVPSNVGYCYFFFLNKFSLFFSFFFYVIPVDVGRNFYYY